MSVMQSLMVLSTDFTLLAARAPKFEKGTRAYHMQHATVIIDKIDKEAQKQAKFAGSHDNSRSHQARLIKYMDGIHQHPQYQEYIKHMKHAMKAECSTVVASDTPMPLNTKMWSKIKARAKAKFDVFPSWVAGQWIASEYKKAGGKYSE